MIKFRQKGDFKKLYGLLEKYKDDYFGKSLLEKYAQKGLENLVAATPVRTGKTAASWKYEITIKPGLAKITYYNTNETEKGQNIALLIQYGHSGKNGWIQGRDYINPAIQPLFDQIIAEALEETKDL